MASFDIRTVVFSFVLINIVSTLVMLYLWVQYRSRYNGIGHLLSGFILQSVAYVLIISRGIVPDWLSIEVGNSLSIAGVFIGYIGLTKYTGRVVSRIPDYMVFIVVSIAYVWFKVIRSEPSARYVILAIPYLLIFSRSAWLLIFGVPRNLKGITKYTGFVCMAMTVLAAGKIIDFIIRGDKPADYFQSDGFEALTMIGFGMLVFLLVVAVATMLNRHLLEDILSEEEKFSTIFHTAFDSVILSTVPEGRIVEVNEKFCSITGYSLPEVQGKTASELNLWGSEKEQQEITKELAENGRISEKECSFRIKNGDCLTVVLSIKTVSVRAGRIYVSSISDTTERRKLQDAIRYERNLLKTLVDNLPDPVNIKNEEGRYLLNNKAHLHVLGVDSQEDTFGKTVYDFFPEDEAATYFDDDKDIFRTGRMIIDKIEYAKHVETGFPYWHTTSKIPIRNDKGKIIQLLTISHDITELKRAEDILRETDEFNRSLLATIPYGMGVVDETGTILFVGEKLRKILGSGAIGEKCWELYRDSKEQCEKCPLKDGIKTGVASSLEAHGVLGGKIFCISHTGMIFHGKKAMLEIFHDVTERKKSETDLIRSKEKAEESDRLKTAFLHNISHEIRTPMNAIVGFANLLRDPGLSKEDRDSYTDIISKSSHQLLSIVNDVIEISNVEAGRLKLSLSEASLGGMLDDVHKQFQTIAAEKNIELSLETPDSENIKKLITDCTKFIQVFSNLLNNAFKFTQSGKITFGYTLKDSFIECFVSDTGIGIDESVQEQIFERFYQVDNTVTRLHEGTGIGLSICKAYVELLGGKIWVRSKPGKGSVFYFTVPYQTNNHNNELQI